MTHLNNNSLNVKIKKTHPDAVIPTYAKNGDAGMDLTITSMEEIDMGLKTKYGFGISIEIPEGFVGLVFPRSSIYLKNQTLTNSVGIIDSGYRGEICAVMTNDYYLVGSYQIGERAAQLIIIPYPSISFEEVSELTESERGNGGYGSTGI